MVNLLAKASPSSTSGKLMLRMVAAAASSTHGQQREFSLNSPRHMKKEYKVLVLGGGAGGCSTASRMVNHLGKGKVAIIEPSDVLPKNADWIKARAVNINPEKCIVSADNGDEIHYDYLVIATGLVLHYERVKGLVEALETPGVGSNYHRNYVEKTWKAIQDFPSGGKAVFTFPNGPVKCAGAPQKIMYLSERILTKAGKKADIEYHTVLPVIFGVKKYADALWDVVAERRNIQVNLRSHLVEVDGEKKEAKFENLDKPDEPLRVVKYDLLHATPPMAPPAFLAESGQQLTDGAGFVDVDKFSLQHTVHPNIFGIGDSSSIPTSKTAAAVAGQVGVLSQNLKALMAGKPLTAKYDGYTSCPLVTGPGECILAEFDFSTPPMPKETFPFNQAKPRWSMYNMKAHAMPQVYWQMLAGRWGGPKAVRKLMHLGMVE